jgi:hypothetical protein
MGIKGESMHEYSNHGAGRGSCPNLFSLFSLFSTYAFIDDHVVQSIKATLSQEVKQDLFRASAEGDGQGRCRVAPLL